MPVPMLSRHFERFEVARAQPHLKSITFAREQSSLGRADNCHTMAISSSSRCYCLIQLPSDLPACYIWAAWPKVEELARSKKSSLTHTGGCQPNKSSPRQIKFFYSTHEQYRAGAGDERGKKFLASRRPTAVVVV